MTVIFTHPFSEDIGDCKELMSIPYRNLFILSIYEKHSHQHMSAANVMKSYNLKKFIPQSSLYESLFKLKSLGFLECRRGRDDQRLMEFKISLHGVRALEMYRKGIGN